MSSSVAVIKIIRKKVGSIMQLSYQMALCKHCNWWFSFRFVVMKVLAVILIIVESLCNNSNNMEKTPNSFNQHELSEMTMK